MALGLGIGITKRNKAGGVFFPDTISDPIEKAIVQAFSISEAEYTANGVSNFVEVWVRATENVTLSGSEVTAWGDRSGNGYSLTPSNTGPTVADGAINGIDAIQFSESNNNIEDSSILNLAGTAFFVLNAGADPGYCVWAFAGGSGYGLIAETSTNAATGTGVGTNIYINNSLFSSPTRTDILNALANVDSVVCQPEINTTGGRLGLGAFNGLSRPMSGVIAEFFVLTEQNPTADQRNAISQALATKYGITLA